MPFRTNAPRILFRDADSVCPVTSRRLTASSCSCSCFGALGDERTLSTSVVPPSYRLPVVFPMKGFLLAELEHVATEAPNVHLGHVQHEPDFEQTAPALLGRSFQVSALERVEIVESVDDLNGSVNFTLLVHILEPVTLKVLNVQTGDVVSKDLCIPCTKVDPKPWLLEPPTRVKLSLGKPLRHLFHYRRELFRCRYRGWHVGL